MRTIRFHTYGEPADVLRLEEAALPDPRPGQIRIRVAACGLNPADWALCRGLFARELPRGIGLDVTGVVDAVGEGVSGVEAGTAVLGPANYADHPTAGASDFAILDHWAAVAPGLGMAEAASLPMAVETAYRYLDWLGVAAGKTVLVNGAGSMIGFAAVQMARLRGARTIATAGETFAERLRALGAVVTPHGEGLPARIAEIVARSPAWAPDLVFDAAPLNMIVGGPPVSAVLSELVEIAHGDPRRVITCADFAAAAAMGVRNGMGETPGGPNGEVLRYDVLGQFARLAAEGRFSVPVARAFPLEAWREALELSVGGRARGKLVLLTEAGA
ncbi:MAG: NADP-dependent oxidoreductase [Proteobacteria bacterium]|nr:NADP-dependent oxidoreductase [Pseudomonadota bacterium]